MLWIVRRQSVRSSAFIQAVSVQMLADCRPTSQSIPFSHVVYIVALEVFCNEMVSKRHSDDPVMIPLEICLCHVPEEVEPTAWLPWLESSEQHRENGEHHCSHRVVFNRHEYSCRYIMRCIQRVVFCVRPIVCPSVPVVTRVC